MSISPETESKLNEEKTKKHSKVSTLLFLFEIAIVFVLLGVWFFSDSVKTSRNLVVLFFYSFPSEFLFGLLPHEPILLYYGNYYSPMTVSLVSVISTVIAEGVNYSVLQYVSSTKIFERIQKKRNVKSIVKLFNKAPFIAIVVAGFTPLPLFPIRLLVVISRYPVLKYMFGVMISRAPRFFIIAHIGHVFKIPVTYLIALFFILIIIINLTLVKRMLEKPEDK
jgi:membrane protein YqaA with SNARE-associated domain